MTFEKAPFSYLNIFYVIIVMADAPNGPQTSGLLGKFLQNKTLPSNIFPSILWIDLSCYRIIIFFYAIFTIILCNKLWSTLRHFYINLLFFFNEKYENYIFFNHNLYMWQIASDWVKELSFYLSYFVIRVNCNKNYYKNCYSNITLFLYHSHPVIIRLWRKGLWEMV